MIFFLKLEFLQTLALFILPLYIFFCTCLGSEKMRSLLEVLEK